MKRAASSLLFGLAPDGVCHAYPVTRAPVSSYLAFSPLFRPAAERYVFCGTFRRLTPPSCYEASCPAEFGLSSSRLERDAIVCFTLGLMKSHHLLWSAIISFINSDSIYRDCLLWNIIIMNDQDTTAGFTVYQPFHFADFHHCLGWNGRKTCTTYIVINFR